MRQEVGDGLGGGGGGGALKAIWWGGGPRDKVEHPKRFPKISVPLIIGENPN